MLDWPLLAGPLPVALGAAGVAGGVFLLARPERRWWTRVVPAVLLGAVALTGLGALLLHTVVPDPLPVEVLAATGAALAGVGLGVAGLVRAGWGRRAGSVLAAVAVVVGSAQVVNGVYREYPTLRTVLGLDATDVLPFAAVPAQAPLYVAPAGSPVEAGWRPPPDMPATGVVSEVDIPATVSGFPARPARVYLPPAYLGSTRAQLPVLVLLSGQPGSPQDWFDSGGLAGRMDAYAAAHSGLAPVVVVPDHLGAPLANPLCVDSPLGNAATYLTTDVPAWIHATLQVAPDARAWAVGGLSNGGTCSVQLAVNAPEVYPTFVSVSGEDTPTLGDPVRTVQDAFGGDDAAFRAVNPLDVLATRSFPDSAGYLVAGAQDTMYLPQAQRMFAACQAAGMDVQLQVIPGGHTWQVWGPGLGDSLPWLGTRLGLTS